MTGSGVRRGWRVRKDVNAANREVIARCEAIQDAIAAMRAARYSDLLAEMLPYVEYHVAECGALDESNLLGRVRSAIAEREAVTR